MWFVSLSIFLFVPSIQVEVGFGMVKETDIS